MVTELIRPVNYNPGISQKLIKLEINSCTVDARSFSATKKVVKLKLILTHIPSPAFKNQLESRFKSRSFPCISQFDLIQTKKMNNFKNKTIMKKETIITEI